MKDSKIAIWGAGGFGREVRAMVETSFPSLDFQGFLDDDPTLKTCSDLKGIEYLVVAVASPTARKSIVDRLQGVQNGIFTSLVHPDVFLHDSNSVGAGTVICSGTKLTVNIKLGRFNIINLNCVLGHDVVTGNYCSIMPSSNILGGAVLGEGVFVGAGATIFQNVKIGDHAIVGAGAVVSKDVAPHTTVVGVPAKPLIR